MPNHCRNRLTVRGSEEARAAFQDAVAGDHRSLDFGKVIPEPPGGAGLDWRIAHWGSKWGAYDTTVDPTGDEATVYTFSTAWAPPHAPFMRAMEDRFPDVRFDLRYAERGGSFYGWWTPEEHDCLHFQGDDIGTDDAGNEMLRAGLAEYAVLFAESG